MHACMPRHTACRTLVPRPGIEPVPRVVEARTPNHWTAREFPDELFKIYKSIKMKESVTPTSYMHLFPLPSPSGSGYPLCFIIPIYFSYF